MQPKSPVADDLFTTQAAVLLELAGARRSIAIKTPAGASVDYRVKYSEELIVSFAKIDGNQWRAGVRKARSRQLGVSVTASLGARAG